MDATVLDIDSEDSADIVLADVPCSGYGVIGKKPDIKYKVTPSKQEEIVILQRKILDRAARYVKRGTRKTYRGFWKTIPLRLWSWILVCLRSFAVRLRS